MLLKVSRAKAAMDELIASGNFTLMNTSWRHASTLISQQGLSIGSGCEILNGYDFGSGPYLIEIGDNVRITDGVRITTHDGGMWVLRNLYPEFKQADKFGRVKIGNNCHIGMNALIVPGITIGNNCIIGAGAIVTHDISSGSIAVGIPARVIRAQDNAVLSLAVRI